jgi:iron uptake system component EfeO
MKKLSLLATLVTSSVLSLVGCASAADDTSAASSSRDTVNDGKTDAQYAAEVDQGLHDTIAVDIDAMLAALTDLQAAAPTPANRGWDGAADADAITAMKAAWVRARQAYERIEGVVAPIFPFIDVPIDDRYEGFLATLGATGDQYLFDGTGVTGMHAIERILYVDSTPSRVVQSESVIPGYKAAALPATAQEAADFKAKLCAKALSDGNLLKSQWTQVQFDPSDALAGLTDLMIEQREKSS